MPHSTRLSGRACPRSAKASGGENLQMEEPVGGGYSSAFHLHATLTRMLGAPLIRDEVVQVRKPRERRLLAATGMVKPFHHEELAVYGIMGLIQQRARHRHPLVCKDRI